MEVARELYKSERESELHLDRLQLMTTEEEVELNETKQELKDYIFTPATPETVCGQRPEHLH